MMLDQNSENDRRSADDLAFRERLVRFQDNALSPAEQEAFEREMAGDAAKRKLFSDQFVLSMLVHEQLRQAAYRMPSSMQRSGWRTALGSRAAAIVAGVLFGMCGASIVLAYAVPVRSVAVTVMASSPSRHQVPGSGLPTTVSQMRHSSTPPAMLLHQDGRLAIWGSNTQPITTSVNSVSRVSLGI